MMRSLYSGVAGLKTHQTKMDVIGNNIANVNTVGFKSSSVTFSDLLYQTTQGASGATANVGGINAKQIGLGAKTAATAISITSQGASQTTGGAFDLKLTDGSTTNFFIVNNGSENLFTRAGAFTVDSAGNLVQSSTGYYVMGWQVDPTTGSIRKDTVSKLQVMNADAQTSAPEATTEAYISGVLDKNDVDVNSDDGYYMNLNFYDQLGYSYTAKFSVKVSDEDAGEYTISLKNIYDSEGNDILASYVADGGSLSDLFGTDGTMPTTYDLISKQGFAYDETTDAITWTDSDGTVWTMQGSPYLGSDGEYVYDFSDGTTTVQKTITEMYGISSDLAQVLVDSTGGGTSSDGSSAEIVSGKFVLSTPATFNKMVFDLENVAGDGNGALWYVGDSSATGNTGEKSLTLNMSVLGGEFEDIDIDFSSCLNYDNNGTSSMGITRGNSDGITGLGKALGALTGLSIDQSGCIYGTYDNGNTTLLGQIPVAQFANASGLEAVGSSLYKATLNSGDFDGIGVDVTADGGSMATGQLEMSNVDLSTEFTDMITTQRGFQANSRIITTSDTLLEELINLKR